MDNVRTRKNDTYWNNFTLRGMSLKVHVGKVGYCRYVWYAGKTHNQVKNCENYFAIYGINLSTITLPYSLTKGYALHPHTQTHTYVYTYTHTHKNTHKHTHVHTDTQTQTDIQTHTNLSTQNTSKHTQLHTNTITYCKGGKICWAKHLPCSLIEFLQELRYKLP